MRNFALKSFVYATPSLRPFGFGSSNVAALAPVALGRTDDAARAGVAAAVLLAGVGADVFFAGDVVAVTLFFAVDDLAVVVFFAAVFFVAVFVAGAFDAAAALAFFAGAFDVAAALAFFAGAFDAAAALALFAGALLAGEPLAVDLVAVEFLAVFFAGGLGAADAADLEVR